MRAVRCKQGMNVTLMMLSVGVAGEPDANVVRKTLIEDRFRMNNKNIDDNNNNINNNNDDDNHNII